VNHYQRNQTHPGEPVKDMQATIDELTRRGHNIVHGFGDGFGGYQGIRIDQEHGTLHGGTEPRKDGAAVGY